MEDVAGPYSGRDHDSLLATRCFLDQRLGEFSSYPHLGTDFLIYGDPAYAGSRFIHKPYRRVGATEFEQVHNTIMSTARVQVEVAIGEVTKIFPAMDFTRLERLYSVDVGKKYLVAVLLRNAFTVIRGENPISKYFNCSPPTLEEWLSPRHRAPPRLMEMGFFRTQ